MENENRDIQIIKGHGITVGKVIKRSGSQIRVAAYCRVSTDGEEQLNSYESQKTYYEAMIQKKEDWVLAGIYADQAITGTSIIKRDDFQRMIKDCLDGKIDMIICKSISRFARNTVDTLQQVRLLKDHNVEVFFEEENIHTLSMDGELLLTVLSSVAQQEVQNISEHVKTGLNHKMESGQIVGFSGCLGYDYDPATKKMTVNKEEAKIVKYIFGRYLEGAGARIIGNELSKQGYLTKRGKSKWLETTIIGILRNEKYIGDLLSGKTITVDPISKRRLKNIGEGNKYLMHNHHEAIISKEDFEKVQDILNGRTYKRAWDAMGHRIKVSRMYAFSGKLECGFCGGVITRRSWHGGTDKKRVVWLCENVVKKGKKYCPDSKAIDEEIIKRAFVEAYSHLAKDHSGSLNEFLKDLEASLSESPSVKELENLNRRIKEAESKKSALIDALLGKKISDEEYNAKYQELTDKLNYLYEQRAACSDSANIKKTTKDRIELFRKTLIEYQELAEFDRAVFDAVVDKVIVGSYDEDGKPDPYQLTFVFKAGMLTKTDAKLYKTDLKSSLEKTPFDKNQYVEADPNAIVNAR